MNVRPVGRTAALVEVPDPAATAAAVRAAGGSDAVEVVPGAENVLLVAADAAGLRRLLALAEDPAAAGGAGLGAVVDLEVRYDGPDLEEVGRLSGLGADGVAAAHAAVTYRGAFSGFAPGFCYLEGLPAALRVPRLAEPRPSVPPGSVAVADRYSAVYPRSSPGGWRLLGRTDAALWHSERDPPALLRPGTTVRFHPVDR